MKRNTKQTRIGYVIICKGLDYGITYLAPRSRTFDVKPDGKKLTQKQLDVRNAFYEEFLQLNGVEEPETDRAEIFKTRDEAKLALKIGVNYFEAEETYEIKPAYI